MSLTFLDNKGEAEKRLGQREEPQEEQGALKGEGVPKAQGDPQGARHMDWEVP